MNDFKTDLKFSHSCEDDSCWEEIYSRAFPHLSTMVNHRQDGDHQRLGIDRTLVMENSKVVTVDEKARRIEYPGDILLEYISNDRTGAPGWAEKPLLCDYIAVAYIPSRKCFLLPVIQLQSAWAANKADWITRYKIPPARNAGYNTLNCAVPEKTLFSAIGSTLRINW